MHFIKEFIYDVFMWWFCMFMTFASLGLMYQISLTPAILPNRIEILE